MNDREPVLNPVPLLKLRPTQVTVGLREVAEKRRLWESRPRAKKGQFLGVHLIPVIVGPKQKLYLTDHHHLALALYQSGVEHVLTQTIADLSRLEIDSFWMVMDCRGWCHPYNAHGRRADFGDIPTSIKKLEDDPFRSLAGALRRAGGFAKDTTPFSEFQWADFLRRRVPRKSIEDDFDEALTEALKLAQGSEANYLPGWSGPLGRWS